MFVSVIEVYGVSLLLVFSLFYSPPYFLLFDSVSDWLMDPVFPVLICLLWFPSPSLFLSVSTSRIRRACRTFTCTHAHAPTALNHHGLFRFVGKLHVLFEGCGFHNLGILSIVLFTELLKSNYFRVQVNKYTDKSISVKHELWLEVTVRTNAIHLVLNVLGKA